MSADKPNVGQQFEQLPLYSHEESSWPPAKEPHMMSPEEFETHPDTVFHASYRRLPEPGETYRSNFNGIHAGTEQSALERISTMGPFKPELVVSPEKAPNADQQEKEEQNLHRYAEGLRADQGRYDPPRAVVHALNLKRYGVQNLDNPLSDWEANGLGRGELDAGPVAYKNEVEDKSSVSVVMKGKNFGPLSHRQYVDEAVKHGKWDEVHPTTKAAYRDGSLGMQTTTPEEMTKKFDDQDIHSQHSEGLFPYVDITRSDSSRPVSREELDQIAGPYGDDDDADAPSNRYDRVNQRYMKLNNIQDRSNWDQDSDVAERLAHVTVADLPTSKPRLSELGDLRRGRQFAGVTP